MVNNNDIRLIETLIKGRDSAKRLQNHLHRKASVDVSVSDSIKYLLMQIYASFSGGLSMLNSSDSGETCEVRASRDAGLVSSGDRLLEVRTRKKPLSAAKTRRGCYKRRRTLDSWVKICSRIEDDYAWRKYGQKEIQNSKFPRCYFRCSHKHVHGCKAVKQVQKLNHESNMFHITYFGHHTCPTSNNLSHNELVIDFEDSKNQHLFPNSPSTITNIHIDPFIKQEDDSKGHSVDVSDNISSGNDDQLSPTVSGSEVMRDNLPPYLHPYQIKKRSDHSQDLTQKLNLSSTYFLYEDARFNHDDSYASTSSNDYLDLDFLNNGDLLSDIHLDGVFSS